MSIDQPYHHQLSTYVEEISEDFGSTFMVLGANRLQNMIGMLKNDFETLTEIVQKYIPGAELKFTRLNWFPESEGPYDCYVIELVTDKGLLK